MSVKKNFIYNSSYQILLMIIPLITTPYISRVIGAEGIGVQSYTYSIASYFVLIAMLGLNNHGNRSIAMVREDKDKLSETFWSIYSLQMITSLTMIFLYIIYISFFVKKNKIISIIQLLYVISALFDINWFFFGIEKFKLTVTRNTIIKLLSLCSIFLFVKNRNDLWIYALITSLGIIVSQLMLWPFLRKEITLKKVTLKSTLRQFKPAIILFIPILSVSIYKIMDKIMIGSISDITQVAFYENSEKIINIPLSLITALGTVMLPKISNLVAKGYEDESKMYISQSLKFSMFISIGSLFGLIGVSPVLIPVFLGSEFNECISLVSMLAMTILFIGWANVIRTQYLIPKKKDKIYIFSTVLGALVNIVVNLLLIREYGAKGAAIGTIIAEATVAIYQTYKIKQDIQVKDYIKDSSIFFIPGMIMCMVISFIGNKLPVSILTGVVQTIFGLIIYIIFSTIILYIKKDTIILNINNKKINNIKSSVLLMRYKENSSRQD